MAWQPQYTAMAFIAKLSVTATRGAFDGVLVLKATTPDFFVNDNLTVQGTPLYFAQARAG